MNFKKITTAIALTISALTISACSTATDDFDIQSGSEDFAINSNSNGNLNSGDSGYQGDTSTTFEEHGGGNTIDTNTSGSESLTVPFGEANIQGKFQPLADSEQFFKPIYFARNRYTIGTAETLVLDKLALYLKTDTTLHLAIEGHCSIRGSEEFNMSLGEKRAQAVSLFLQSRGIAANRLNTVSYGEERPAVAGNTESAHAANRRSVLVLGRVN